MKGSCQMKWFCTTFFFVETFRTWMYCEKITSLSLGMSGPIFLYSRAGVPVVCSLALPLRSPFSEILQLNPESRRGVEFRFPGEWTNGLSTISIFEVKRLWGWAAGRGISVRTGRVKKKGG